MSLKFRVILIVVLTLFLTSGCARNTSNSNNDKQINGNVASPKTENAAKSSNNIDVEKTNSTDTTKTESGFARDFKIDEENNPIDKAFEKDFEIATATPELNYLSEKYLDAWKSEWGNITNELRKSYHYKADKDLFDGYKKSFDDFVKKAGELEWTDWTDTSVEPGEKRTIGSGAGSASNMEEAGLYKRQVLYLIDKYYSGKFADNSDGYKFVYKGKGAEIKKIRSEVER